MDATASRPLDLGYSKLHFILKFAKYLNGVATQINVCLPRRTNCTVADIDMSQLLE